MSYILRALKRSQIERAEVAIPSATVAYLPHVPAEPERRSRAVPGHLLLGGALLAAVVVATAVIIWRLPDPSSEGRVASSGQPARSGDPSVAVRPAAPVRSNAEILAGTWPGAPSFARQRFADLAPVSRGLGPIAMKSSFSDLPAPSGFHPPEVRIAQSPTTRRVRGVPPVLAGRDDSSPQVTRPAIEEIQEVATVPRPIAPIAPVAVPEPPVGPATAEPEVLRLSQLPIPLRRGLPEITMSVHAYDPHPERRFVRINGAKHREGDRLDDSLWLQEITDDGAILKYRDLLFSISAF
jgi:general secretion pathway protein B